MRIQTIFQYLLFFHDELIFEGKSISSDFHEVKVQSHSWMLDEGRVYMIAADSEWVCHFGEDSVCSWQKTLSIAAEPLSCSQAYFAKGKIASMRTGAGVWYTKNSESVAKLLTAEDF